MRRRRSGLFVSHYKCPHHARHVLENKEPGVLIMQLYHWGMVRGAKHISLLADTGVSPENDQSRIRQHPDFAKYLPFSHSSPESRASYSGTCPLSPEALHSSLDTGKHTPYFL